MLTDKELEEYMIKEFEYILTVIKWLIPHYGSKGLPVKPKDIFEDKTKQDLEKYMKFLSGYSIIETMDTKSSKDALIIDINPNLLAFYKGYTEEFRKFFETDDKDKKIKYINEIFQDMKLPHCQSCCEYSEGDEE